MKYNSQVIDHFQHPRNFGSLKQASGVGTVGNPVCGDVMKLYLKVEKNKKGQEIIKDIKFETFGCAAAIATSSVITEIALGKTLQEVEKITNQEVADQLGGLPSIKMHCSVLAAQALTKAIEDYKRKTIEKNKKKKKD